MQLVWSIDGRTYAGDIDVTESLDLIERLKHVTTEVPKDDPVGQLIARQSIPHRPVRSDLAG